MISALAPAVVGLPAGLLAQAAPVQTAASSGSAEFWVFWIMAPLALGTALSMVLMRNAVHAALMLVLNFFAIAVLYAVLEAQFLAVVQVIVYAGAIMVLFLFVIMLLGVVRDDPLGSGPAGQKSIAAFLGVLLVGLLAVSVAGPWMSAESACPTSTAPVTAPEGEGARGCAGLALTNAAEGGNVAALGRLLFTDYVWPFEVTSVLLVIAAIGAMVLGRKSEDPAELSDAAERQRRTPVLAGRADPGASSPTSGPAGGSAAGATDEGGSR